MKIGVLADTHGFFHPRLPEVFAGVEKIIHAGDMGSLAVYQKLQSLAPVIRVAGNHEPEPVPSALPDFSIIELAGRKILLTHVLTTMSWNDFRDAFARSELFNFSTLQPFNLVIFGHTHFPIRETIRELHFLNPGYAGPDPHEASPTAAILEIDPKLIQAKIINL